MKSQLFWQLGAVSDARLRAGLRDLLDSGSRTEARILAHLAELEERKIHLKEGCESLYAYCINVLRLSNSEAFYRITAARIARRFPVVFTLIERPELHLTAVCLLRDYLTQENHEELLGAAAHKTKWQIQERGADLLQQLERSDPGCGARYRVQRRPGQRRRAAPRDRPAPTRPLATVRRRQRSRAATSPLTGA